VKVHLIAVFVRRRGAALQFEIDLVRWLEKRLRRDYSTNRYARERRRASEYKASSRRPRRVLDKPMRDAVEAAREPGVNLAFMGAMRRSGSRLEVIYGSGDACWCATVPGH